MENSENPKQQGWSTVRKAQVIGVLCGAVPTLVVSVILMCMNPNSVRRDPHDFPFSFSEVLWLWISLPVNLVLKIVGGAWSGMPDGYGMWAFSICLVLVVNGVMFGLIGTVIGWLIQKSKAKS